MQKRMGRVLALFLTAGMISTSPEIQVLAEESVEIQADIIDDVQTEDLTEENTAVNEFLEEDYKAKQLRRQGWIRHVGYRGCVPYLSQTHV